jgi:hypothetical protein
MDHRAYQTWFSLFLISVLSACNGQMKNTTPHTKFPDRQPAVAGSFYPSKVDKLEKTLSDVFAQAVPYNAKGKTIAIISPHAGYAYSAKVAASAFNQIDPDIQYDHIFVIGSSHRASFNGASVYSSGNFVTPLGAIPIDTFAEELVNSNAVFTNNIRSHNEEHGIEVQLPFLQYYLKRKFSIIPILLGTESAETCRKIGLALKPYFTQNNLFIISSDFSHYPGYKEAVYSDSTIIEAIESNSPQQFMKIKRKLESENIPNLLTSMCGWTSALTLLNMSNGEDDIQIRKVDYQNSGDISNGDKAKVVGYAAIAFEIKAVTSKSDDFKLNLEDKKVLLEIARNTITEFINKHQIYDVQEYSSNENISQKTGAFVTLLKNGELRGCVGTFKPTGKLYGTIHEMAISAATSDNRFSPVQSNELTDIDIEISVLTPLKRIGSINEIELGKHGIYIIKGDRRGTLLPQVSIKNNWTKEEFLGYCARDKVGIGMNGWKDAEIFTYEAIVFSEREFDGK